MHDVQVKKSAGETTAGEDKVCSSVNHSPKACCSSSSVSTTAATSKFNSKTCCSRPTDAKDAPWGSSPPVLKCCGSTVKTPHTRKNPIDNSKQSDGRQSPGFATVDLEKGSAVEHVVAQVSGMTCTGCERKLRNVLSSISGVNNVKTSCVVRRLEFDLNVSILVEDVISLIERQTEFKCILYQGGYQIEVLVPERLFAAASGPRNQTVTFGKEAASFPHGLAGPPYPPGVEKVTIFDNKGRVQKTRNVVGGFQRRLRLSRLSHSPQNYTARIFYNPRIVGARDLLEKGFDTPLSLAPLNSGRAVAPETKHLRQTLYMTLLSAILTIPVLVMAWASLPADGIAYGCSSLALATLVQVIIAGPFYSNAIKALLFSGMIEMDLLIVISTTTAYIYSVVAFVYDIKREPLSTGGFFQTSTLLVTLIMFGRLASAYARQKAADSISIQALQPSTALLSEGGKERLIDVRDLQYNDLFKILPDTVVPTDGVVVSGETEMDESMITGEAIPVPKFSGSRLIAGSINGPGQLLARLTKLPIDNTISRIAGMVDEAKLSKPKVQQTADRVASYFVPCILALTVVVFLIWIAVGIALRGDAASVAVVTAFTYALAALIVSCPCAIGLAVPMVMVIAGGVGAKHGVIFQSPDAIENARKATHVVFDKTGTLTQGKFVVVEEVYRDGTRETAASIARQMASGSNHPVSQALTAHLESVGTDPINLEGVSSVIGKGMKATLGGQLVRGGNPLYTDAVEDSDVQRLLSQGLTVFCLARGSGLLAIYGLRDALRPETKQVVSVLQASGVLVSIVSGDSSAAVDRLATELGIPLPVPSLSAPQKTKLTTSPRSPLALWEQRPRRPPPSFSAVTAAMTP